MQTFLEYIFRGDVFGYLVVYAHHAAILVEDRCTREAKELCFWEETLDGCMIFTKLTAVALVKDKDDALVAQALEALAETIIGRWVERYTQFLDSSDDDFVGIIVALQSADECSGVGVLLYAALLELIELVSGLLIEVFAVHDKDAFLNILVILEQGRCLETGKGFARTCGVPYIAVLAVLLHAVNNALHCIDLIWTHDENLLLCLDEHHIAADKAT